MYINNMKKSIVFIAIRRLLKHEFSIETRPSSFDHCRIFIIIIVPLIVYYGDGHFKLFFLYFYGQQPVKSSLYTGNFNDISLSSCCTTQFFPVRTTILGGGF